MFSRVYKATKSFFGPEEGQPHAAGDNVVASETSGQLQEPDTATGMVTTRRQSQRLSLGLDDGSSVTGGTPKSGRKSAAEETQEEIPKSGRPSKRRRTSLEDTISSSQDDDPAEVEETSTPQPSKDPAPTSQKSKKSKRAATKKVDPAEESAELPLRSKDAKSLDMVATEQIDKEASAKAASSHVRFGSEDPEPEEEDSNEPAAPTADASNSEDSDDDDDAPEAVQNAAQLQSIRDARRQEEEAIERAEAAQKQKRQEKQAKLQKQAEKKKKQQQRLEKKKATTVTATADNTENDTKNDITSAFLSTGTLPALLPDDFLSAEPTIRPPTPEAQPPSHRLHISQASNKRKFFDDEEEETPTDIKLGNTSIRILEDSRGRNKAGVSKLPPKVSKDGKKLREAWLAGRRKGRDGEVLFQRKKRNGGGFVRK